jgi:copper transport protein
VTGAGRVARRILAVMTAAVALVAIGASPAYAHAELETTDPQAGGVYDAAPKAVTLEYSEPVEASLGAVRLYDGRGARIETGSPSHPGGRGSAVRVDLPGLEDGSYVVTWRVVSADSHPVQGAFTFQVGPEATADDIEGLTQRLLASQGGNETVGAVYAVARFGVFAALAVLVGGAAFLVLVWPRGRSVSLAARLVWAGWAGAVVSTVVELMIQGPYAAGLGLADAFDLDLLRDVLETRSGRVWLARLILLGLAAVLLWRLLPTRRRPVREYPLTPAWGAAAVALGVALVATPGLGGHAGSGDLVPLAVVADTAHLGGVALWLGGLALLFAVFLPRADADELRTALPRYSQLALGAVVVIIATGVFQAWRQVGSLGALRDTDFGRLLVVKVLLVGVLVVAAAFSREVVNRTFRARTARVAVGAGGPSLEEEPLDPFVDDESPLDDATEVRNLRRSVVIEVLIAIVILGVTALLVNTPPGRSAESAPFSEIVEGDEMSVDLSVDPADVGENNIHATAVTPTGAPIDVQEMSVTLRQPDRDIAAIDVPLERLGPGHYVSYDFQVPIAGDWVITVRALLDDTNDAVVEGEVPIG